jgi:hypothetical protein
METKKLHPNNWIFPGEQIFDQTLKPNQEIKMIVYFKIDNTITNLTGHIIYSVIKEENKVTGRLTIAMDDQTGFDGGRSYKIVEYPIENEKELKGEIKEAAIQLITIFLKEKANNPNFHLIFDTKNPLMIMELKNTKALIESIRDYKAPLNPQQRQLFEIIFGLEDKPENQITIENKTEKKIQEIINPTNNSIKQINNLEKAATEKKLIKKYGRAKMLKLAKQINYKGEILNKSKTKIHVNK